jgi:Tfp pilus assembly protein PilV
MNKSGFLLIELLIAISIFILSVMAIFRLQVQAVKTRNIATERMQSFISIMEKAENLKIVKKQSVLCKK